MNFFLKIKRFIKFRFHCIFNYQNEKIFFCFKFKKVYKFIYLKRVPGVFFDVDGVLRKGKNAIPGSREALIRLRYILI